ncbi:MAG: hypothetical protein D3918_09360 [Candidatus Electrothrix sp. AX2]|nr:hypothetical protein [Candidatus Electrothrix gigas]
MRRCLNSNNIYSILEWIPNRKANTSHNYFSLQTFLFTSPPLIQYYSVLFSMFKSCKKQCNQYRVRHLDTGEKMKKVIAAGAVLLFAGSVQLSHASPSLGSGETEHISYRDWAISGYIGMADFEGEEKPDPFRPGVTHEMESDVAGKFGVILSKYYNNFSFNFGLEYILDATIEDELGNELAEHSHIPLFLGVNYHFYTHVINPYIGAGIGYSFNDSSESEFIAGQGISTEVDDSLFYYLTAGIEYPVRDYSFFIAGKYSIEDADVKGTVQMPTGTLFEMENEGSLDRYEVNLGVKYFF